MLIFLNGKKHDTNVSNIEELCIEQGYLPKTIATALNGKFIPIEKRNSSILKENDDVEILSPKQGG